MRLLLIFFLLFVTGCSGIRHAGIIEFENGQKVRYEKCIDKKLLIFKDLVVVDRYMYDPKTNTWTLIQSDSSKAGESSWNMWRSLHNPLP